VRVEMNPTKKTALFLSLLVFLFAIGLRAQDKSVDAGEKTDSASKDSRLTIVVTGGKENKPVDSASVYVKFVEARRFAKDRRIEMNLKTNLSGECHVPVISPGKFLIQIVAPGWKTFGKYYDIDETKRTINIHLGQPHLWY